MRPDLFEEKFPESWLPDKAVFATFETSDGLMVGKLHKNETTAYPVWWEADNPGDRDLAASIRGMNSSWKLAREVER